MAVDLYSEILFSVAEYSSIFSGIGVVICFMCMVIFITRIHEGAIMDGPSALVRVKRSAVQLECQKVGVPFTCAISSVKDPSSKELHIEVRTKVPCSMQAMWHVHAESLHSILYLPWPNFIDQISLINAHQMDPVCDIEPNKPENVPHLIKLNLDRDLPSLGKAPRSKFPLLLLLQRNQVPILDPSDVGALVAVVHISDEECPMEPAILYQYLKQYSDQVANLTPLYTQKIEGEPPEMAFDASENSESLCDEQSPEDDFGCTFREGECCVICKVMLPTRALLPCRHVCICAGCFPHIDSCPLCRSHISAFFLIDTQEENRQQLLLQEEEEKSKQEQLNIARHRSFLNNMNRVLNSFLGINE